MFFVVFYNGLYKETSCVQKNLETNDVFNVLFIAQPKSAGSYIRTVLMNFFDLPAVWLEEKYPTRDLTKLDALQADYYYNKSYLAWHHLAPSDHNIALLKKYKKKFLVHMREPRQALLSGVHFMAMEHVYNREKKNLPDNYSVMPLDEQMDFFIKKERIHDICTWIEGWLDVYENESDLDIKITTFEDFQKDPLAFFKDIVEFYGYDPDLFTEADLIPPSEYLHFRKGEIDEWKYVLAKKQIEEMNEQIPDHLFEVFGWDRE